MELQSKYGIRCQRDKKLWIRNSTTLHLKVEYLAPVMKKACAISTLLTFVLKYITYLRDSIIA